MTEEEEEEDVFDSGDEEELFMFAEGEEADNESDDEGPILDLVTLEAYVEIDQFARKTALRLRMWQTTNHGCKLQENSRN